MSRQIAKQFPLPGVPLQQSTRSEAVPPPVVSSLPLARALLDVIKALVTLSEGAEWSTTLYDDHKGELEEIIRKWSSP